MTLTKSSIGVTPRLKSDFKISNDFEGRTMGLGLPKDFRELIESLNARSVRYLLIGGYAVGNYGHSRSTNDIDIFVARDEENAKKIVAALEDFGFGTGELTADLFTRDDSLVVLGVEPMAVDILNYCLGLDFESAYMRRAIVNDDGLQVDIVGYDDLLINKRAVGRLKDQADVEYLERIGRP